MTRRVVVTGLGCVTPLGLDVTSFWRALLAGRSGIRRISRFDPAPFTSQIAGQVEGFALAGVTPKQTRHMDRFTQFAVSAAREALGPFPVNEAPERIGAFIGCGMGGLSLLEEQHRVLLERGPQRVSPFLIPMMIGNMAAGNVTIQLGLKGPSACQVTACASASHAIGDAFRLLQRGDADAMLAGGTESTLSPMALAGFAAARALSSRNHEPQAASRPFDRERDGFVMGEGAGILLLETLESAQRRGATIYAELTGYASTSDAHHITQPDPDGDGITRCMQLALADARINPEDVQYVNAHGTSTPLNDKVETAALKRAFGAHAQALWISSTKSMVGHLLGAAGGVEAVATVMSLAQQVVHPTANLTQPDPDCDLDYVPLTARKGTLHHAISNSMGFGGHNATLVFRRFS